jgi:hypothetical protein
METSKKTKKPALLQNPKQSLQKEINRLLSKAGAKSGNLRKFP